MANSGEKWGKSGGKWGNGKKWGKVGNSKEKWLRV